MLCHMLLALLTVARAPFAAAEKAGHGGVTGEVVAAGAQTDNMTLQLLPTTMPAPAGGRCSDDTANVKNMHIKRNRKRKKQRKQLLNFGVTEIVERSIQILKNTLYSARLSLLRYAIVVLHHIHAHRMLP